MGAALALERREDGTIVRGDISRTGVHQQDQRITQALQFLELVIDDVQLSQSLLAHGRAWIARLRPQREQVTDLLETKAQHLGPPDELHLADSFRGVVTETSTQPTGLHQQAFALVESHGLDADLRRPSEGADGRGLGG